MPSANTPNGTLLPLLPILAGANPNRRPLQSLQMYICICTYDQAYVALSTTTGPPAHLNVNVNMNNAPSDPILDDAEIRSGKGTHTKAAALDSFLRALSARARRWTSMRLKMRVEVRVQRTRVRLLPSIVEKERMPQLQLLSSSFNIYTPTRTNPTTTRRKSNKTKAIRTAYADSDVLALPCGHVFHAGCLAPWFRSHTTCTMCRFDIDQPHRRGGRSDGCRECRETLF